MGYKQSRKTKPRGLKAPPETKWCPRCFDFRPLAMFGENKGRKDGRDGYCIPHEQQTRLVIGRKQYARIKAAKEREQWKKLLHDQLYGEDDV